MANNGRHEKLTIEGFDKTKREKNKSVGEPFTVMFNPVTLDRKIELEYEDNKETGGGNKAPVFTRIVPETFDCEFTIDGTGTAAEKVDVTAKVNHFLTVCRFMNGDIHRPNYLRLSWGDFVFDCVLESADISYTMFTHDIKPLRAKISASFRYSPDVKEIVAKEDKKSPDLSHVKTILEGDKLTLLTSGVYGENKSLYFEVARFNRLNNFRKLRPGMTVVFPPIDKTVN